MRIKDLTPFLYEVPGGPAGGGAPTPPTPQPTAQPPAGQGDGQGFRQTYFPNVPDDQWSAMEPHIQGVNRHVTQLEQRYAPLKSYTPEAVQGLARFAQAFDQNPIQEWINLATMLQSRGILDPDLDLEHLAALAQGEDPEAGVTPPNGAGAPNLQGIPPEVGQLITGLQQQVQQLSSRLEQNDKTSQQRAEDAALKQQMTWMKDQLKSQGFDEKDLTDERMLSSYIAHRGNAQAAVQDLAGFRTSVLGGIVPTPENGRQNRDLDTSGGVPTPKNRQNPSKRGRGMFSEVSAAAEQAIAKMNQE